MKDNKGIDYMKIIELARNDKASKFEQKWVVFDNGKKYWVLSNHAYSFLIKYIARNIPLDENNVEFNMLMKEDLRLVNNKVNNV